jgi:hypothetical protein
MIPLDLSGKVALVTGVGDNESFAWFISKALKAAGAKVVLACHPRVVGIVESFLTRDTDRESRELPYGGGEFTVEKVLACDALYDTMDDVPPEVFVIGPGRIGDADGVQPGHALGDLDRPIDAERVVRPGVPRAHRGGVGEPAGQHLLADDAGDILDAGPQPGAQGAYPGQVGRDDVDVRVDHRGQCPGGYTRIPSPARLKRPSRCTRSRRIGCGR